MEDRVLIGEGYSWSTANWDPKALSVIDDQNIVLVPFDSYTYDENGQYKSFSGLQIVEFDLDEGDLVAGGAIEHIGTVQRTRANSERIFAVSTQLLQVINAKDINNPKVTAILELCNNIVDVIPFGDYCVQVISEYNYYTSNSAIKLRTLSADEPDKMVYLAEKTVGYYLEKIYINGNLLYLICNEYSSEDYTTTGHILVFDYTTPTAPVLKSDFEIEYYQGNNYYWYYDSFYYGGYYNPRGVAVDYRFSQVDGDIIVYHPSPEWTYSNGYDVVDDVKYDSETNTNETDPEREEKENSTAPEEPAEKPVENEYYLTEKLYIIDLSDPNNPVDAATVVLENATRIYGLYSNGNSLFLLQYEDHSAYDPETYRWEYKVKDYITIADLSDPSNPVMGEPINIPGGFIGASDDGTVIFTREGKYDKDYNWHQSLYVLGLDTENNKATLSTVLNLGDEYPTLVIEDTTIFISYNQYSYYGYYEYDDVAIGAEKASIDYMMPTEPVIKTKIQIIDASDPSNLKLKKTLGLKNYCSINSVENDKLIIQLNDANGVLIYDLTKLDAPSFLGYYPIQGWINSIRENTSTGRVYLACGYYGVLMIDTKTTN
jgi:hypothetical protein